MSQSETPSTSGTSAREVLIVDDHPAIHQALKTVINGQDDMVVSGMVRTREEALEFIDRSPPSVAIVDISLEQSYGLRLVEEISEESDETVVVVFSMFDEHVYAQRAISAGAHAYLMKRDSTSKIITAIRRALEGNIYVSGRMASHLVDSLAEHGNQSQHPLQALSDRELAVFHLLGQGHSLSQISHQLDTSLRTVRTSRRQLRKKLELDSMSDLLQLATEWFHHHSNQIAGTDMLQHQWS